MLFEGKKNKYFTWIAMATIRNNTWCIISHSTHCYLDKIFIFFPCSDSRLQECNYSGPQSKLCKASNLLRWETAIRDSRYSRRGKIRRRRQGGWWEKLASTVQSGVQKNWNSARYIWLFSSSLSFDSMVNVKLDYILPQFLISYVNFIAVPFCTKTQRNGSKG